MPALSSPTSQQVRGDHGPAELEQILRQLRSACSQLRRRTVDEILATLDEVAEGWLDPSSEWRREAEERLPEASGLSPQMIRTALPLMFEPVRSPALRNLLDRELGQREVLDRPGGRHGVTCPFVITHILPGNLPGLAVVPVFLSLAIKSAVLLKPAAGERLSPLLLARSIAATDPALGRCVAVHYWPGGDAACEALAFSRSDLVVMSGSEAAIAAARHRCPCRFIGHGHRVSFAVVTREIVAEPTAVRDAVQDLALDISLWDQRGCLSPQLCFVEGDPPAAAALAGELAAALRSLAEKLPPGPITQSQCAAIRRLRDGAEWRGLRAGYPSLFAPDSAAWTVVVEPRAVFRPTPLCRSIRVIPVPDLAELAQLLEPARPLLEAAGVAATAARRPDIEDLLLAAGVHRVCPLGRMQRPSLSWKPGGRSHVAEWVEWNTNSQPRPN